MSAITSVAQSCTLMLYPDVGIWKIGNELYFDRKFYDGVLAYTKYWPGSFRLIIRLSTSDPSQFGLVWFGLVWFSSIRCK